MSAERTRGGLEKIAMAEQADKNIPKTSKAGKGTGTKSGGVSGGKHSGGTTREDKNATPRGKGSGNR